MAISKPTAAAAPLEEILERYEPDQLPLDLAALSLAAPFVEFDPARTLHQLDGLARRTETIAGVRPSRDSLLQALRIVLFTEERFAGNARDYYSPRNSFLPCVLESRRGVPITLSLVMMEVGRRCGLSLSGVGLPCHFMTRWLDGDRARFFDPFHGGVERTRDECIRLVSSLSAGAARVSESHFEPIPPSFFLMRMLCNLRMIYRRSGDRSNLSIVLEQSLLLTPSDPDLHFELAALEAIDGDLRKAARHLTLYADLGGVPKHSGSIHDEIAREIRARLATLN